MDRLTIEAHGRSFRTLKSTLIEVPWFKTWMVLHPDKGTLQLDMCAWALSDILNFLRTQDPGFLKEGNLMERRFLGLLPDEPFEYSEDTEGLLTDIHVEGHLRRIRPYIANKIPMTSSVCSGRWSGNELDVDVNHFDAIVSFLNGTTTELAPEIQATMELMGGLPIDELDEGEEEDAWEEAPFEPNSGHSIVCLVTAGRGPIQPQKAPWNLQVNRSVLRGGRHRFTIPRTGDTLSKVLFVFSELDAETPVCSLLESVTLVVGGQNILTLESSALADVCDQQDNLVELSLDDALGVEIDGEKLGLPLVALQFHRVDLEVCFFDAVTHGDVFLQGWFLPRDKRENVLQKSSLEGGIQTVITQWERRSSQTNSSGGLDLRLQFSLPSDGLYLDFHGSRAFTKHPLIRFELMVEDTIIASGSWHVICRGPTGEPLPKGHYFVPLYQTNLSRLNDIRLMLETHTPNLTIDVKNQQKNVFRMMNGMGGLYYIN